MRVRFTALLGRRKRSVRLSESKLGDIGVDQIHKILASLTVLKVAGVRLLRDKAIRKKSI